MVGALKEGKKILKQICKLEGAMEDHEVGEEGEGGGVKVKLESRKLRLFL